MNARLAEYIEAGMAFDADEREVAAVALLSANEPDQAAIDAEWDDEIALRIDEIMSGKVPLVDGEETRRLGRERLAARYK
jgi:hypothetical protein